MRRYAYLSGVSHMSKAKNKNDHLSPSQKRIILYLAKNEPQTINEINKGTHPENKKSSSTTYHTSHSACKDLERQNLIRKIEVKPYHSIKYDCFWLTPAGVYQAVVEGTDAQDLLEKTVKTYPDNKTLQLFLEMKPFTGIEIYKAAFSAVRKKGKLEQSDILTIMLSQMQRTLSTEQSTQPIEILKKYPDEYEKQIKRAKQLAEFLEKTT